MSRPVDAALIAKLFDRYAAALELYASQRTTTPQDCVQEAFLELARQDLPPVDPGAWLFRVVRNRALNAARAEHRRATHEQTAAQRQAANRRAVDPGDAAEIADLLHRLSDEQREVVVATRVGEQLIGSLGAPLLELAQQALNPRHGHS